MDRSTDASRKVVQILLAGLVASACACSGRGGETDTSRIDSTPARDSTPVVDTTRDTLRASAIQEANRLYDYGKERPPLSVNDKAFPGPYVADDSVPRMWIATARLKAHVARPANRIIARIRSERAYPPMGIAAGYNYVWRNSWDSTAAAAWMTKIIASDTTMAQHTLVRDPRMHEYTHGMSPLEPRLVRIKVHSLAIALCLDDPSCSTGHCGYY